MEFLINNIYIYVYIMKNIIKKNYTIKKILKNKCNNSKFWQEDIPINHRHLKQTKKYKNYNKWLKNDARKKAINFFSELNIPLLPKKKQPVIGSSKFLLPYIIMKNKFNVFVVDNKKWTMEDNNNLIHTIGKLNEPIIRLVTKPKKLVNNNNKLSITSNELCILFNKYNYQIYEYKNIKENLGDIYFLIKNNNKIIIDNNNLKLVNIKNKKVIYL